MKNIILILTFLTVCFSVTANNEESSIVLTRTIYALAVNDNKLTIKASQSGDVGLTFPQSHILYGATVKTKDYEKANSLFTKLGGIKHEWNYGKLKHKLDVVKKNLDYPLFYSSDRDLLQLTLKENNKIKWQITINNLQELKHYYPYLGEWQTLVDIIVDMESLSMVDIDQIKQESKK